jgi:hypothetical protein
MWIERCKQHNGGRLSWQRMSELVREDRRNKDSNVTHREIDLSYGLKDGQVSNFTHFIQLFYIILMRLHVYCIFHILSKLYKYILIY